MPAPAEHELLCLAGLQGAGNIDPGFGPCWRIRIIRRGLFVWQGQPLACALRHGIEPALSEGALRFSLGWSSVAEDIDMLLAALEKALARAKGEGSGSRLTDICNPRGALNPLDGG